MGVFSSFLIPNSHESVFVCIFIVYPYSALCLSIVCALGISSSYLLSLAFSIKLLFKKCEKKNNDGNHSVTVIINLLKVDIS